jgi:L-alanine-DL-glutamate epimerase-like enolase superfamily enzyme
MTATRSAIAEAGADLLLYPLPGAVGGSGVTAVDVVAVDLADANGVTGTGFTYGLRGGGAVIRAAARDLLDRLIVGEMPNAPAMLWRKMDGALNRLGRGAYYLAMTAIDLAVWDLHAKQRGVTLGAAMGGRPRAVPVYGSGGYRPDQSPEETADQARRHAEAGFPMIKLRLAADRSDIARMAAARDALPASVDISVDTNEKCDLNRAQWLARACADQGILWLEEPLKATDYAAHAALARTSPVPIATGEHLQGTVECMPLFRDQSCAVIQPDLAAMGGITECLRVAHLAEPFGVTCAPHFLPALFVHLAAAALSITWLEDFPLLEPLFDIDVRVDEHQRMAPGDRPGHGLVWADGVRAEYQVRE